MSGAELEYAQREGECVGHLVRAEDGHVDCAVVEFEGLVIMGTDDAYASVEDMTDGLDPDFYFRPIGSAPAAELAAASGLG